MLYIFLTFSSTGRYCFNISLSKNTNLRAGLNIEKITNFKFDHYWNA
jgi:hypothetical protein